ncbi:ATP-binding protein [Candidatus Micrarchaeota archaeon]|nr:ATP-binding protein [Candidatus Micrarchaeota archaeon]
MFVGRELGKELDKRFSHYSAVAIVGPRQAGKTTLVKQKLGSLENTNFVSLDDPDARSMFDSDVKKFEKQYLEGYQAIGLDEAQYGKDAGMKLKYLIDQKPGRKIIVTSSSETLLNSSVLSYLVGRISVMKLYPFDAAEFFSARKQAEYDEKILERHAWEHAVYGGYPKIVLTEDFEAKKQLLKDLYSTLVLKDVARFFSITDADAIEKLVRYLAFNNSSLLSYSDACSGLETSFQTLKKYLNALEKSYVIERIPPFHTNKAKELSKQPKTFFVDTGLANAVKNDFPATMQEQGKLFENYVFTELKKQGGQIKYWRTKSGAEVDFIIERQDELIPVEAKLNASGAKIERSLRSFISEYEPKNAFVAFYEGTAQQKTAGGCKISFVHATQLGKKLSEAKNN